MRSLRATKETKKKTTKESASRFQFTCMLIIFSITYLFISPYISYVGGLVLSFWLNFLNILLIVGLTLAVSLFCLGRIMYHLFIYWKQLTWRLRLMRLVVSLCVAVLPLSFICVPNYRPGSRAYLLGLQTRILNNKPDIWSIREWMSAVNIPSEKHRFEIEIKNAPAFIKKLEPDRVVINKWSEYDSKPSFRSVEFSWQGFALLVMEVGPPEMPLPKGAGHNILTVEPGVYVTLHLK